MRRAHAQGGWAMMGACALLLVAGTLGAVLLEREQGMRRDARVDARRLGLDHALEGGLATVRHALARDAAHASGLLRVGRTEVRTVIRRLEGGGWQVTLRPADAGGGLRVRLEPAPGLPRVTQRTRF